jgi:hypothetical protein
MQSQSKQNVGLYFHPPPNDFSTWYLIKHMDYFTFHFCKKEREGVNYEDIQLAQDRDQCQKDVIILQEDNLFNCLVIIHFSCKNLILYIASNYDCTLQVIMTLYIVKF